MPVPEGRRTKMLELVRRWRDSGVKARVFAQEQGVTPWTLYYWRQRLVSLDRSTRRRRRSRRVTLAPVHVVAGARDVGGDLEILLASGDRVRVGAGVSADTLRQVVAVLRTAC
jgi:hypothetical protein